MSSIPYTKSTLRTGVPHVEFNKIIILVKITSIVIVTNVSFSFFPQVNSQTLLVKFLQSGDYPTHTPLTIRIHLLFSLVIPCIR